MLALIASHDDPAKVSPGALIPTLPPADLIGSNADGPPH
jgi:hypothetical protein